MPKLVVIGTVEVTEGRRSQLLPLLKAHGTRCLNDEPGTLHFEVLVPREDDTKLFVYEVYRDDDAFEAHLSAASRAQFREEAAGMFKTIHATKCTPAD